MRGLARCVRGSSPKCAGLTPKLAATCHRAGTRRTDARIAVCELQGNGQTLRADYAGATHHVFVRVVARSAFAVDAADYERAHFLLEHVASQFELRCHAWCYLPNHFHMLVTSKLGNLSQAMHWLGTCTAQSFNKRHERSGHSFQGRFGSKLGERDQYLLELARYLPRKPVRAGQPGRDRSAPGHEPRADPAPAPAIHLGVRPRPVGSVSYTRSQPVLSPRGSDQLALASSPRRSCSRTATIAATTCGSKWEPAPSRSSVTASACRRGPS